MVNKRKIIKRVLLGLTALVLIGGGVVVWIIGPRNVIGMIRYDQRKEGTLRVGDRAPDVELLALDGTTKSPLVSKFGTKPVVLIFGSFT